MRIPQAFPTLRALGRGTLRLLAPPVCPACWAGTERPGCCAACAAALAFGAEARLCPRCGASLGPYLDAADGCFACRNDRFAFDTVVRLGRYHAALGQACQRIKREGQRPLAAALADLLLARRGEALRRLGADLVAPIPLHWRRRWRRGYNQADELAQRLARGLGLPFVQALRRTRSTTPQADLAPSVRRTNVVGAFRVRRPLPGQHVLLVDDILTTGATCHQAARALRAAGAARVSVAVLARGEDFNKALTPEA